MDMNYIMDMIFPLADQIPYLNQNDGESSSVPPSSSKGMTQVDAVNIVDNQSARLKTDQKKMERNKKKEESRIYTIVKVAREEDLFQQIGRDIYFDLVDYDKVRSFRIHKRLPFNHFKAKVMEEFGVPVQLQRFWLWAKRQNRTYRPHRPLTDQEEMQCVGQLKKISSKNNAELKLFLEVKHILDMKPMFQPDRTEEDILLFFKLYDPEKEELRFLGRLFVKSSGKPFEILAILKEKAGLDRDERIELYEEIKFDPAIMCELIDKNDTFRSSQLENGDIICFQKLLPVRSQQQCRYPDVPSFLESVHNSQVVHFRSLEKPKEDDFCLELSKLLTYDNVTERVAKHLGLDDPTKLRLTTHNCYSQEPKPQPIKYQGVDHLSDMLVHYNQTSDILYYEVLDIPLPELQGLKTLKVTFYQPAKEEVVHTIRLPKESTVGDVINDLKNKVELSHPDAELRVLELFYHKIYKIFPLKEKIKNISDQYWTLRAEEIPEEEKNLGPLDRLIHVYHFKKDPSQSQMQVQNFGEPFIMVIHEGETLAEVKLRIQKKLEVSDDEFAKWKFAFLSLGRPEYLQDSDVVSIRFQGRGVYGAWEEYLGLEHSDSASNRADTSNQVVNHMPATRNHKPSRGIEMQNNKLSHSNVMEAQPQPVPQSDFGNFFNDFMNDTQTRVDVKRNEPAEVLETLSEVPTQEYPSAGQLYEGGRHHPNAFDEKFEDIGGFSVLKAQASIYKQIWLKYGHIASSQVLTASYIGQVTMVAEIMKTIMEMHQHRLPELSFAMIDSWDEKIKMVEVLKFNVKWFRERFEDVKKDFYGGEKLKTLFVEEKLKTISDAKSELVVAEEQVTILQDKLKMATEELKMVRQEVSGLETSLGPLLSERQIYLDKSASAISFFFFPYSHLAIKEISRRQLQS